MSKNGIGAQYDQIAEHRNEQHLNSDYGVVQVEKALSYTAKKHVYAISVKALR